ncbi:MAG: hypothetical protein ABIO70_04920 [Pseudomonadota bacterium]
MRNALPLVGLLLAAPLLLAETCVPVPPEQDEVLASDPEAVARLEAEHGPVLTMLREYLDAGDHEDTAVRYRVRPGSIAWDDLQALKGGIPRLQEIVALQYTSSGQAGDEPPFCGEGGEITTFTLDLLLRDFPRRLEGETVTVELCRVGDDGGDQVRVSGEAELIRDPDWAARVLRRSEAEVMRMLGEYQADADVERTRILSRWLGCPDGTTFRHHQNSEENAYFCASGDTRHGPCIEGDLTDTLVGPRLVEGQYRHGMKDGLWKQYDAEGRLLSTTEWQNGERVGWGGGF